MAYHPHFPMFVRRLGLLGLFVLLVFAVLTLQLLRLSVVEGGDRRERADGRLDRRNYLPTYRGRILDRHGRALALDVPSYDVAISYELITGSWQDRKALAAARRAAGGEHWSTLGMPQRIAAMGRHRPAFQAYADRVWNLVMRRGHLTAEELTEIRDEICAEVQHLRYVVHARQYKDWKEARAEQRQQVLMARLEGDEPRFKPQAIREERKPHVILARVDDETAFAFRELAMELAGELEVDLARFRLIEVQDSTRRHYPRITASMVLDRSTLPHTLRSDEPIAIEVEGVADHIVGAMSETVWRADVLARPFVDSDGIVDLGGYRTTGDRIGTSGIERVFERRLRGARGVERLHRAEAVDNTPPVPGSDVRLTIDIDLQTHLQTILSHRYGLTLVQPWHAHPRLPDHWPLNAAAVVMDVHSAEVLAAVSMPTLAMGRYMDLYRRNLDQPGVFRPTEAIYPPGSIIKPLILAAAVQEGLHDPSATIECTGHFFPDRVDVARCWIFRERYGMATHGELAAEVALAKSCNMFFYTLGDRLGIRRLRHWLGQFGLGHRLEVGLTREVFNAKLGRTVLAGEAPGVLPPLDGRAHYIGIGQGAVNWTPIQAANAYATLARYGEVRDATLIVEPRIDRPRRDPFPLPVPLVRQIEEGLRLSVEWERGTGYHIMHEGREAVIFNAPGVTVWGKTGTATAPPFRVDLDGDGEITPPDRTVSDPGEWIEKLDHSWFVGLVGPEGGEPLFSIAVIVEYGGSGGRVSGPIANQIIHALQTWNYLPRGSG